MKHAALLLLVVTLPVASISSPAHAGGPPVFVVSGKTASDRADELVRRALVLGDKDRYAEAEPLLREAWGLKRSYDIAANLAIFEGELGKWRDAAEHMTFALKNFPTNGKPEHRTLGELVLSKALARVTALTIKVNVEKAEILVDGKSVGNAPLADVLFVEPGQHVVTATLAGYSSAQARLDARKGAAQDVTLTMGRADVAKPGEGASGPRKPVIIAGAAVAGVGVVAGAVLAVLANAKAGDAASEYDKHNSAGSACGSPPPSSGPCAELWSARRAQATLGNAAAWSFIGAGAVGAGTLIYALAAPRAAKASAVRAAPLVAAGGGGLLLQGEW